MSNRVAALLVACIACSACASAPADEAPAASGGASASPASPVASVSPWTPVAGFLGSDDATAAAIAGLLKSHGIESASYGSLGYTVSVPASHAEEARALLQAAIDEGMPATVYRRESP